ncbi:hypothetical protein TrispH2_012233, partial [Trichoplax sp. H2]
RDLYSDRNVRLSNCIINVLQRLRDETQDNHGISSTSGSLEIKYEVTGNNVNVNVPTILKKFIPDFQKKLEELLKKNLLITPTSSAYVAVNYSYEETSCGTYDVNVTFSNFDKELDVLREPIQKLLREKNNDLLHKNIFFYQNNEKIARIPKSLYDFLYHKEPETALRLKSITCNIIIAIICIILILILPLTSYRLYLKFGIAVALKLFGHLCQLSTNKNDIEPTVRKAISDYNDGYILDYDSYIRSNDLSRKISTTTESAV